VRIESDLAAWPNYRSETVRAAVLEGMPDPLEAALILLRVAEQMAHWQGSVDAISQTGLASSL
jgi:hypothetical protein